jgi:hypothetical protein
MKVTNFDIGSLVSEILTQAHLVRQEPSVIDRLIQEELLRFTSLDELEQKLGHGFDPLVLADAGAQPLDGSTFEDPRQWADELLEDTTGRGAVDAAAAAGRSANEPSSGVERMVEPMDGGRSRSLRPGELASALEGEVTRAPAPSRPASSGGSSLLLKATLVVLIIALLGVGAGIAYLLLV